MSYLLRVCKVVEGKLDKRVNKFDILLAITKNAKSSMDVCMFNNSYNPQRLKAEHFIWSTNHGQKYKALPSSKIDPKSLTPSMRPKTSSLCFPESRAKSKSWCMKTRALYGKMFVLTHF